MNKRINQCPQCGGRLVNHHTYVIRIDAEPWLAFLATCSTCQEVFQYSEREKCVGVEATG